MIQDFILTTEFSLLNSNEPTHFHVQTGTLTNIDLAITSADMTTDFTWSPCNDLHGSDHFPIKISEINSSTTTSTSRYKFHKADWTKFYDATIITRETYENILNIDELVRSFNNLIYNAINNSIPQTNPIPGKYPVPWWNQNCSKTQTERKRARRKYQRTKLLVDKIALNRASAIARKVKKLSRRDSWKDFVSSINSETPMGKIWKKVSKISKKYSGNGVPCIENQGTIIMDEKVVGDLLGSHLSNVSSNNFYSNEFNTKRESKEKIPLRFNSSTLQ